MRTSPTTKPFKDMKASVNGRVSPAWAGPTTGSAGFSVAVHHILPESALVKVMQTCRDAAAPPPAPLGSPPTTPAGSPRYNAALSVADRTAMIDACLHGFCQLYVKFTPPAPAISYFDVNVDDDINKFDLIANMVAWNLGNVLSGPSSPIRYNDPGADLDAAIRTALPAAQAALITSAYQAITPTPTRPLTTADIQAFFTAWVNVANTRLDAICSWKLCSCTGTNTATCPAAVLWAAYRPNTITRGKAVYNGATDNPYKPFCTGGTDYTCVPVLP